MNHKKVAMTNLKVIKKGILRLAILGLLVSSCSDDSNDAIAIDEQAQDLVELNYSAQVDEVDNLLGDIIVEVFEQEESDIAGRNTFNTGIPECVTIIVVAEQNYRQVTLDFGSEGCLVRGHLLRGQLIFDYTRNPDAQTIAINYNLVDFFVDARNLIGSRSILRERSNANGNPQYTHDLSITVIWPNGVQAFRGGTRIREWVEGFGSGDFSDNVFEITGSWTASFVNGNTHTYDVIIPLRREVSCDFLVSGSFEVQRTNFGGLFDFGEGTCDNQAAFTFNNGVVVDITLN